MIDNPEHLYYVALAYLATTIVIVFLVLQSLFAAAATQRALEASEPKDKAGDAAK